MTKTLSEEIILKLLLLQLLSLFFFFQYCSLLFNAFIDILFITYARFAWLAVRLADLFLFQIVFWLFMQGQSKLITHFEGKLKFYISLLFPLLEIILSAFCCHKRMSACVMWYLSVKLSKRHWFIYYWTFFSLRMKK